MARRAPVLPGPGSYRLLAWVARLGIAGIEPARLALGVSQAVAYSHVARLVDARLLSRAWVGDGGGGVVAVARAGAREAHERGTSAAVVARSAVPRSVRHGRAVSWAAALLGLRDRAWVAERELHAAPEWQVAVYWPSRPRVNVETNRLLAPTSADEVDLTIRVLVRASSPTYASLMIGS